MHCGISDATWYEWQDRDGNNFRPDLLPVVQEALKGIRQQKFEMAASDLLNANIIARDLGLIDRMIIDNTNTLKMRDITPGTPAIEAGVIYDDFLAGETT